MNSIPTKTHSPSKMYMLLGVILIASVLRAPITSVGTLLSPIQADLNITTSVAGVLTSLPIFIFAIISLLMGFTKKLGLERSLVLALILIIAGSAIRSTGFVTTLFAGTILLSIGIAVGNVLLPTIIKRDFPQRVTMVTSLYASCMLIVAAISSGLAVPIAAGVAFYFYGPEAPLSWQASLAVWGIIAVVAMFIWIPLAKRQEALPETQKTNAPAKSILKAPIAWQVTIFMGLQSMTFYVLIAWLATILQSNGYSAEESGWLIGFYQLLGLGSSLTLPFIVSRTKDQRLTAVLCSFSSAIGVLGLFLLPDYAMLWLAMAGIGGGGNFVLALAFISLRTNTHQQAISLSAIVNGGGYCIAAVGPFFFGTLHGMTNSWDSVLLGIAFLATIQSIFGWLAGRNKTIEE